MLTAYREPAGPTGSARVGFQIEAGTTCAFVNPYMGQVLGTVAKTQEFNEVVRKLHRLEYVGA